MLNKALWRKMPDIFVINYHFYSKSVCLFAQKDLDNLQLCPMFRVASFFASQLDFYKI